MMRKYKSKSIMCNYQIKMLNNHLSTNYLGSASVPRMKNLIKISKILPKIINLKFIKSLNNQSSAFRIIHKMLQRMNLSKKRHIKSIQLSHRKNLLSKKRHIKSIQLSHRKNLPLQN